MHCFKIKRGNHALLGLKEQGEYSSDALPEVNQEQPNDQLHNFLLECAKLCHMCFRWWLSSSWTSCPGQSKQLRTVLGEVAEAEFSHVFGQISTVL